MAYHPDSQHFHKPNTTKGLLSCWWQTLARLTCYICIVLGLAAPSALIPMTGLPKGLPQIPQGANPFANIQIPPAELESLFNYLENLDDKQLEELEKTSRKMLQQMGFDPETLKPIGPAMQPPIPPQQPIQPVQPRVPVTHPSQRRVTAPPKKTLKQAHLILSSLIERLSSLRHKVRIMPTLNERFNVWNDSIDELLYLINVVDKPKHHNRLATAEFDALRAALNRFDSRLSAYEPQIQIPITAPTEDNPYDILGVSQLATPDEIEAAYNKKKRRLDRRIRQMQRSGYSKDVIERKRTEGEADLAIVTAAYKKLHDPQSRARLDKEIEQKQSATEMAQFGKLRAIDQVIAGMSQGVYADQLINKLTDFLKKYAPQELEERARQEGLEAIYEQEQKRLKELALRGVPERPVGRPIITTETTPGTPGFRPPLRDRRGRRYPFGTPRFPGERFTLRTQPRRPGQRPGDNLKARDRKPREAPEQKDKAPKAEKDKKAKKPKDEKNAQEVLAAMRVNKLNEQLDQFNATYDAGLFNTISAEGPSQELPGQLAEFAQGTNLGNLSRSVSVIKRELEEAKPSIQKQYKKYLKATQDNRKEFSQNIAQADKALSPHSTGESFNENGQTVANVASAVKGLSQDIKAIENIVNPPKTEPGGSFGPRQLRQTEIFGQ